MDLEILPRADQHDMAYATVSSNFAERVLVPLKNESEELPKLMRELFQRYPTLHKMYSGLYEVATNKHYLAFKNLTGIDGGKLLTFFVIVSLVSISWLFSSSHLLNDDNNPIEVTRETEAKALAARRAVAEAELQAATARQAAVKAEQEARRVKDAETAQAAALAARQTKTESGQQPRSEHHEWPYNRGEVNPSSPCTSLYTNATAILFYVSVSVTGTPARAPELNKSIKDVLENRLRLSSDRLNATNRSDCATLTINAKIRLTETPTAISSLRGINIKSTAAIEYKSNKISGNQTLPTSYSSNFTEQENPTNGLWPEFCVARNSVYRNLGDARLASFLFANFGVALNAPESEGNSELQCAEG